MKNQYQLSMRMIYLISIPTFYLKKNIDQIKGNICNLIDAIYKFMRCFVCNQVNNGYC